MTVETCVEDPETSEVTCTESTEPAGVLIEQTAGPRGCYFNELGDYICYEEIRISGLLMTLDQGGEDTFTVTGSDLLLGYTYQLRVKRESGVSNIGFTNLCSGVRVTVPSSSANRYSYSHDFTLHGCSAPRGTVTAEVLRNGSVVASRDKTITVNPLAPPTPTGLRVTSFSSDSISLDWDSINGASRYSVSYGSTSQDTTSSSFTARNLSPNTTYTFSVSAYGDGSTYRAAWGPEATVDGTTKLPLPPAPGSLGVTSSTSNSISLGWGSITGVSKYRVSYGSITSETTTNSFTARNLSPNTTYPFSVSAYGDGSTYRADWGPEATVSGSTAAGPPPVPTGVSAQESDRTLTFRWNESTGATSYSGELTRDTNIDAGSCNTTSAVLTCTFNDLTNGTTYSFKVRATRSGVDSAYSSPKTATPEEPTVILTGWEGSVSSGESSDFSVRIGGLSPTRHYEVILDKENAGTAFGFVEDCSSDHQNQVVPAESSAVSRSYTLYACGPTPLVDFDPNSDDEIKAVFILGDTGLVSRPCGSERLLDCEWRRLHREVVSVTLSIDVEPRPLRMARLKWDPVPNADMYRVEHEKSDGLGSTYVKMTTAPENDIALDSVLASGEGLADFPYAYDFRVKALGIVGVHQDGENQRHHHDH